MEAVGQTAKERACSRIPTFGYGSPDTTFDCTNEICACWGTLRVAELDIEAMDRAGAPPFRELALATAARRKAHVDLARAMRDMLRALATHDTYRHDYARLRYINAVHSDKMAIARIKDFCKP